MSNSRRSLARRYGTFIGCQLYEIQFSYFMVFARLSRIYRQTLLIVRKRRIHSMNASWSSFPRQCLSLSHNNQTTIVQSDPRFCYSLLKRNLQRPVMAYTKIQHIRRSPTYGIPPPVPFIPPIEIVVLTNRSRPGGAATIKLRGRRHLLSRRQSIALPGYQIVIVIPVRGDMQHRRHRAVCRLIWWSTQVARVNCPDITLLGRPCKSIRKEQARTNLAIWSIV